MTAVQSHSRLAGYAEFLHEQSHDREWGERHRQRQHYQEGEPFTDGRKVGWVKTEALLPYREYDRRGVDAHPGDDSARRIDAIKDDIKPGGPGWTDPISLSYHHDSHRALIDEGNHRLQAALEAGVSHVPVTVNRAYSPYDHRLALWGRSQVRTQPDRYGCIPGQMEPHEVLPDGMLHKSSRRPEGFNNWPPEHLRREHSRPASEPHDAPETSIEDVLHRHRSKTSVEDLLRALGPVHQGSLQVEAGLFGPEWYEKAHDDEIDAHANADGIRSYMTHHTSPQGHVYRLTHDTARYVTATYLGKGDNRIKTPQIVGRLSYFGGKANDQNNIEGRIYKVFVKPAHRRRGIASAMLAHARAMSPNDDIEHSHALTEDGKAWSEKVGLRMIGEGHTEYHDPELGQEKPQWGWNISTKPHDLYGKGHWRAMFGDGATAMTPWPRHVWGPGQWRNVRDAVNRVAADPGPHITQVDPRRLHSIQPNVTRAGVAYYLHSPEYGQTGTTYADQGEQGNQVPTVLRMRSGKHVILSGHHRAAAALLRGEPLTAAVVHEPDPGEGDHHSTALRNAQPVPGRARPAGRHLGAHRGAGPVGDPVGRDRGATGGRAGRGRVDVAFAGPVPAQGDGQDEHGAHRVAARLTAREGGERAMQARRKAKDAPKDVEVAGVAIKAADTGRVLMIQRSYLDESDPARGTFEFPGGHLEPGEWPWEGAIREWQEEVGASWPADGRFVGYWLSGDIYLGYCYLVPSEGDVAINLDAEDRPVGNPDDPGGDDCETVCWMDPKHLQDNPIVRQEVRDGSDFDLLRDA